jgi:hypothetical protein
MNAAYFTLQRGDEIGKGGKGESLPVGLLVLG